jgi:hypothetical protein
MHRRLAAIACLILVGLTLSGCTKCGWIWEENTPRSCHSAAPSG